jgi:tetratricopeptide (TPR) repeat protein
MTRRSALALAFLALAACQRDPSIVHREAGDDLLRSSDFAGAAREFTESLKLDPNQPAIWEKLAFCRVKTGEKEAAAEVLVKLADFKPSDAQKAEVYRNAAGIFLQGQTAEREGAERYLLAAVRLDPKDEASLTWLGELASQRGGARLEMATAVPEELDRALGYYAKLVELRPDSMGAHASRRIVLVKYVGHLADEKRRAEARVRKGGAEAAAAREQLARIEAKGAELKPLLEATNAKLAKRK